jgi:adenosylcobinamide hydrolase
MQIGVRRATHRDDGAGQRRTVLVWGFDRPMRAVSTATLGGGIGACSWVVNAQVALAYHRSDPDRHLREIAVELGLPAAAGTGMLTAAAVRDVASAWDVGVRCDATVGLSFPVWAAASADEQPAEVRWRPGTINLVCVLPVALCDAALVNAVVTATEAKTQALIESGVPGTGTASDAVVVCCPAMTMGQAECESYGGPRSVWGARLARAVHGAVSDGAMRYATRSQASRGG